MSYGLYIYMYMYVYAYRYICIYSIYICILNAIYEIPHTTYVLFAIYCILHNYLLLYAICYIGYPRGSAPSLEVAGSKASRGATTSKAHRGV